MRLVLDVDSCESFAQLFDNMADQLRNQEMQLIDLAHFVRVLRWTMEELVANEPTTDNEYVYRLLTDMVGDKCSLKDEPLLERTTFERVA